ncbi:hypothetical protein F7725_027007 [Dissostichus mawsoni]|uniref:Major intrinsically disordered Notch2-binding receptor 1-like C-terminal domain-containing protein n=1 Tax=Dissostichus mawsoni TaxID=36200 RepID=A0A7J5X8Q0_DISMA|nr:hypothetical protein F7725_027007 [Dissostichus mawsoni]
MDQTDGMSVSSQDTVILSPCESRDTKEQHELDRHQLIAESKKRDSTAIKDLMCRTFAHRRHDVINLQMSIEDIKDRWPVLFDVSQVSAEFQRITTLNLEPKFMSMLDFYSPKLLSMFQGKGQSESVKGVLPERTGLLPHPFTPSIKAHVKGSPLYTDLRISSLSEGPRGLPSWTLEEFKRNSGEKGKQLNALDLQERLTLQSEFNTLTADKAAELLLKTRSNYYKQGDKAGRLLAHQLRQNVASHQIPRIQTSSDITIDPQRMNDEFRDYYASLYTSETGSDTHDLETNVATLESPSSAYTKNVIVKTSLKIWNQFRRFFGLQTYSTLAPITANHMAHLLFGLTKALNHSKTFYIDNTFASFQQLSDTFALPRQHFFRYLQIRSFVSNRFPQFPNHPTDSPCIVRGSLGKFHKMWEPFYRYIRELDMLDTQESLNPNNLEYWMEDVYTPGYDSLLKRKEAEFRRARVCKIGALIAAAACTVILVIVVPICTMKT